MDTTKGRKAQHNSQVRARILMAAAKLFRVQGYDGVGLNELMAAAGLTRGAFYAHFTSKEDLFRQVVQQEHPLLRKLEERPGQGAQALWAQCDEIFANYLKPAHLDEVAAGCSFSALVRDVARRSSDVRLAYEAAHQSLLNEIARGQPFDAHRAEVVSGLTLAVGAVATAAATLDTTRQSAILEAALQSLRLLWAPLHATSAAPSMRA